MRNWILLFGVAFLVAAGCSKEVSEPTVPEPGSPESQGAWRLPVWGQIVVANRSSGSISVINARTNAVSGTYMLPAEASEPTPEPMYVSYVPWRHRVFVGDRANNRVAVFKARNFDLVGTIPAGAGVFHMWADPLGRQLWVNNDVDNTTTVIDPRRLEVIATVPTPADLVAMGGKPHDVILDPWGRHAYVSVLGVAGPNDYVVKFDTDTFQEVSRAAAGKDPHLSLSFLNQYLFVPCQNSNVVQVFDRSTLTLQTELAVPGAHGAAMTRLGGHFYTTNLTGGGTAALYTIDARSLEIVGSPVDAPYPVPHNIALTSNGKKLFVTHSGGTSDKVTVFTTQGHDPVPEYEDEVTVGLNPFGIAFVP